MSDAPSQPQGTWCPKCKTFNPANSKFCNGCGKSLSKSSTPAIIGCGCFGLIGLIILLVSLTSGGRKTSTSTSSMPSSSGASAYTQPLPERSETKLTLKDFAWRKGGFDTVMIGTFTVRNDNEYAVKDIRIICSMSASSGTSLGTTEETIYDTIPAKRAKTFSDVNMGFIRNQARSAQCIIAGAAKMY